MTAGIASRQARTGIVEGEFLLTVEDFRCLAAMLHADAGISLSESKATLLYSRLARRLRALGLTDFGQYCALLSDPEAREERGRMLAALTTNVTRFFREPHHFEHLQSKVLPPLLAAARKGGRVRIWSAACSNGQEPYTVALTILALMPEAAKHDVRVLATDIDPNMLAEGRAGQYSTEALEPVPPAQRQRWFQPAGPGQWEVADDLKRLVTFREVNLIGNWPMRGPFDAILCRNVMIYFAEDTQATVWNRFTPLLAPGGHLYIGHSERLNGRAADCFETVGITTYRRRAPRA